MNDYYKLENKKPVECSMMEWATSMNDGKDNIVRITNFDNDVRVSTVFLGLDHQFGDGPPILFETMIFGGEHDQYQERYSTWDEAIEGHKEACELIKE